MANLKIDERVLEACEGDILKSFINAQSFDEITKGVSRLEGLIPSVKREECFPAAFTFLVLPFNALKKRAGGIEELRKIVLAEDPVTVKNPVKYSSAKEVIEKKFHTLLFFMSLPFALFDIKGERREDTLKAYARLLRIFVYISGIDFDRGRIPDEYVGTICCAPKKFYEYLTNAGEIGFEISYMTQELAARILVNGILRALDAYIEGFLKVNKRRYEVLSIHSLKHFWEVHILSRVFGIRTDGNVSTLTPEERGKIKAQAVSRNIAITFLPSIRDILMDIYEMIEEAERKSGNVPLSETALGSEFGDILAEGIRGAINPADALQGIVSSVGDKFIGYLEEKKGGIRRRTSRAVSLRLKKGTKKKEVSGKETKEEEIPEGKKEEVPGKKENVPAGKKAVSIVKGIIGGKMDISALAGAMESPVLPLHPKLLANTILKADREELEKSLEDRKKYINWEDISYIDDDGNLIVNGKKLYDEVMKIELEEDKQEHILSKIRDKVLEDIIGTDRKDDKMECAAIFALAYGYLLKAGKVKIGATGQGKS